MSNACPHVETGCGKSTKGTSGRTSSGTSGMFKGSNVSELADYRGSTTGIMDYAKKSDAKEFIIGTENSIVQHLQFACPDKQFYPLSRDCVCHNMKLTTLGDVYQCVKGTGGEEIKLDEEVRIKAKRCIDTMLELGN